MIKKPKFIKPLSSYHPKLLGLAKWLKQMDRKLDMLVDGEKYAQHKELSPLPYRIKRHQSTLLRKLGSSDMYLQHNKVTNLKLVVKALNGTIIRPNETFSYFKLVGKPTAKRGFKEGMELSFGEVKPAIGGGICQSSNLIYWLVLHTPLKIVERHHHSFDPFPDEGRVLPFASGATVMYNYLDLRFKNTTPYTFQLLLKVEEKYLVGELRCDRKLDFSYKVYEKNHYYEKRDGKYFRSNELHRRVIDTKTGDTIKREFLVRNYSQVKYTPSPQKLKAKYSCPPLDED